MSAPRRCVPRVTREGRKFARIAENRGANADRAARTVRATRRPDARPACAAVRVRAVRRRCIDPTICRIRRFCPPSSVHPLSDRLFPDAAPHRTRHRPLPLAARADRAARYAQRDHRAERQRQVEPVSCAAPARGYRAGPRDSVARARGRAAVDAVGGPRTVLARDARGGRAGDGHGAQRAREPEARLRVRGFRLCDRSRAAAAQQRNRVRARSGHQARVHLERADAAPVDAARRPSRRATAHAR
ncbi:hypothetical protein DM52_2873 [Burkholderia mallei]|nr:hypothetical protein DM52_2873 [Burkholderia mallei]